MFTAEDVFTNISREDIEKHISHYDIFKMYCKNFIEIDKDFKSEFYNDNRASCRIYHKSDNTLAYKDFGSGDHYNCYFYVMKKNSCTYREALNIIANDFNLTHIKSIYTPGFLLGKEQIFKNMNSEQLIKKKKSYITIAPRNWNLIDYNYWFKQYNLSFEWLMSFDITPCESVYLHKDDKTIVYNNTKDNPIYAYRFTHNGKYSYKIYFPLAKDVKHKWLFSGGCKENIEGYDQLPLYGDDLFITKSLKDVICLANIGYHAISLQGETNILDEELVNKLKKRFDRFIVFYDNDNQGIVSARKICSKYGFKSIIIPLEYNSKDLSDLIKNKGYNEAKIIFNKMIE